MCEERKPTYYCAHCKEPIPEDELAYDAQGRPVHQFCKQQKGLFIDSFGDNLPNDETQEAEGNISDENFLNGQ